MPVNRYYLDSPLLENTEVVLTDDEFHHLKNVLRKQSGDQIELVDGKGTLATAVVKEVRKREATLLITEAAQEKPSPLFIQLYQAFPRQSKLDWILEKGTELGVSEFVLFPSERSEKRALSKEQSRRAKLLTVSAIKQAGRLFLPTITLLDQFPQECKNIYYGDVSGDARSFPELLSEQKAKTIACLIGPESGLSEKEMTHLQDGGAIPMKLSDGILRTETAAVAAATFMSALRTRSL